MSLTRKRRLYVRFGLGCLVVACALSLVNASLGFWSERNGDLPVYLRAADYMVDGEEIYRLDSRPFTYPPFLAFAAAVLARFPEAAQRPFWYCFNAFLLGTILCVLHRILKYRIRNPVIENPPPPRIFWALLVLLCFRHVSSVFENQSNDLVIVLCVLVGVELAGRRREVSSGVMTGLGAALKATPALFLPVFLWQRRWAAAGGLAAALLAATLLPDLCFPRNDGQLWVNAWRFTFLEDVSLGAPATSDGAWFAHNILNQNLAGTLYRLSTSIAGDGDMQINVALWEPSRGLLKALTLLAQGAVFLTVLLATRSRRTRDLPEGELRLRRLGEGGAIACGMVLLSPMSSKSHFSILLLPVAYCLAEYLYRRRDRRVLIALILVLCSGTLTSKSIWSRHLGNVILAHGSITLCALAALAGTAYLLVRTGRLRKSGLGPAHQS